MRSADFYLAASAVLPILVFAETIKERITLRLKSPRVVGWLNRDIPLIFLLGGAWWWLFYAWAEWISLRSLQLGHSAFGGSAVVWIALAVAFSQLAGPDVALRMTHWREARSAMTTEENTDGEHQ